MKTSLETLYKRTTTGAIQYWKIEYGYCDPDANNPHDASIRKESGQLGTTSPVVHIENIEEGKNIGRTNETTPLQQAEFDAGSDWRRKKDNGYKSLADLDITSHGEFYSYGIMSNAFSLQEVLDYVLPRFNTDASGQTKPMLAKDVKPGYKGVTYPAYMQPKLDGVRCLMVVNVEDFGNAVGQVVKFLSRSGKVYETLGHIETDIIQYIANAEQCPESFILDGEIYSDELTFQEILQASKKQYPNSLKLKFRAYDMVNDNKQEKRIIDTIQLVKQINKPTVTIVETKVLKHEGQIKEFHDAWVQMGYEGAMIRLLDGIYAQGQRSSALLKVKDFNETEYKFIQFEYGQRGVEDLIAVCETDSGQRFKAKMQGSKAIKAELDDEHSGPVKPGMLITIKHFDYTDDKLPRFPIGKALRLANGDY